MGWLGLDRIHLAMDKRKWQSYCEHGNEVWFYKVWGIY
jgi:hypothetical protein